MVRIVFAGVFERPPKLKLIIHHQALQGGSLGKIMGFGL
jgi:hypothetical protein